MFLLGLVFCTAGREFPCPRGFRSPAIAPYALLWFATCCEASNHRPADFSGRKMFLLGLVFCTAGREFPCPRGFCSPAIAPYALLWFCNPLRSIKPQACRFFGKEDVFVCWDLFFCIAGREFRLPWVPVRRRQYPLPCYDFATCCEASNHRPADFSGKRIVM